MPCPQMPCRQRPLPQHPETLLLRQRRCQHLRLRLHLCLCQHLHRAQCLLLRSDLLSMVSRGTAPDGEIHDRKTNKRYAKLPAQNASHTVRIHPQLSHPFPLPTQTIPCALVKLME